MAPAYRIKHRAQAAPALGAPPGRDPANELSDRACEVLDAAQRLSRAAGAPGAGPALVPTLGCLQAALEELGAAAYSLDSLATRLGSGRAAVGVRELLERLRLQLLLAQSTCGSAREATAQLADRSGTAA